MTYQQPQRTLTPPSSTSLPQHWQFVPPPTDGPNTRARRANGQMPFSGTAAPLPVDVASRGPFAEQEESREGKGTIEEWNAWEETSSGQQYWFAPGPTTSEGQTFFAIDPTLDFDPAAIVPLPYTPAPEADIDSPYSNYPPSSSPQVQVEDRRVFSTSSVIDYGSPPTSPVLAPAQRPSTSSAPSRPDSLATGMGMSKEEWLRLGGFTEEELNPLPPPAPTPTSASYLATPAPIADEFFSPYGPPPSHSAHPLGKCDFPPPSPAYALPPPPASAPPGSTFAFPAPATAALPCPSVRSDELPVPPPLFRPDVDNEELAPRPPARSKTRRAPSPTLSARRRPAPYPTSSSSSSTFKLPSPVPLSRNLTPVSNALATYHQYPVPSEPPPTTETAAKKRSHGGRVSVNHIPRPRNAFILFRSHAVSTGLIPKSMGITDHKNISQIVGSVWRGLSAEERKEWDDLAAEEKRQHREKYPDYAFKPKQKGTRAPVGQGKKAKAKAAREAADRAREAALNGEASPDGDGDDEGTIDSDYEDSAPRTSGRRKSIVGTAAERNTRRNELIGQAMLEGEEEDRILERVDEELEQEEEAISLKSPTKSKRSSPVKQAATTPRKTRSSAAQRTKSSPVHQVGDILVGESITSPGGSSSTGSPSRNSPYAAAVNQRRNPLPSSPASSASPSPRRMHQPSSATPTSGRRPLSRFNPAQEQDHANHDLPANHRSSALAKKNGYTGLGVAPSTLVLPPTPHSDGGPSPAPTLYQPSLSPSAEFSPYSTAFEQPLFAGAADSRNFSLGKWELRKPSTAAQSRREQLARQEEEQESLAPSSSSSTSGWLERTASGSGGGGGRGGRVPSFAINPKDFLVETDLEGDDNEDTYVDIGAGGAGYQQDWSDVASTVSGATSSAWGSSAALAYSGYAPSASSSYATTVSRRSSPPKQPFFRQQQQQPYPPSSSNGGDPFTSPYGYSSAASTAAGSNDFHFGEVDLFAKPPPVLGGGSRSVSSSSLMTERGGGGGRVNGGEDGLGISYGEGESGR